MAGGQYYGRIDNCPDQGAACGQDDGPPHKGGVSLPRDAGGYEKAHLTNEELRLNFFLSKGPDVPTYVEYGAADIGVVGSDIIMEEQRRAYEVLDLGFGKCRMCVAGPASSRERLLHHEMIRVASKYPNIARNYFYNQRARAA